VAAAAEEAGQELAKGEGESGLGAAQAGTIDPNP